jgi:hypothetical protein
VSAFNKTVNERQQAGWTALSVASPQSWPLSKRYVLLILEM